MNYYRCGGGGSSANTFKKTTWDDNDLVNGVYISTSTGLEVPENGWSATDFIEINGTEISFCGYVNSYADPKYNAFYDANKTFISYFSTKSTPVVIPLNAKYMRVSNQSIRMGSADNYYFIGSGS